jgi:hypothetical protein
MNSPCSHFPFPGTVRNQVLCTAVGAQVRCRLGAGYGGACLDFLHGVEETGSGAAQQLSASGWDVRGGARGPESLAEPSA